MQRHGWTLHEMIISLVLTAGVMAIATQAAMSHLRFFRGIGEVIALRGQLGQGSAVVARVLWAASSSAGDIVVAQDSAIELHATIGSAFVCGGTPGMLTIPAPSSARGNVLSAFTERPEAGDRVHVFYDDSLDAGWLALRLASFPAPGPACAHFPTVLETWTLELREGLDVPVGSALRFTRPIRFSLYRASDNRWYLGAKDWNGAREQFNTIQPVAGPLRPYSTDAAQTGLLFVYRNSNGTVMPAPADPLRIATVTLTLRGESLRPVLVSGLVSQSSGFYADFFTVTVSLRNAR